MISGTKKSEREYRQLDRLSSSNIRLFATRGRKEFFKQVVKGDKPEARYNRSLKIGSLVHCKVLEPQEFDKKFLMSACEKVPTGNMLEFVEALYKHTLINTEDGQVTRDFAYLAEEAYKETSYSLKLDTVLKRFRGSEAENYYRDLRKSTGENKELVCLEDVSIADKVSNTVITHEYTSYVFEEQSNYEYLNEYQIEEFDFHGIPMKAMIDRLKIDHENKIVWPYDLKVVWDNENFFEEYFLKQRADIQAYIYDSALTHEFPGYEIKPLQFITVDSTNFTAPLVYPMTLDTLNKSWFGYLHNKQWYRGVKTLIEELKWYYDTGNWNSSYLAFKNNGIMTIEL